MKNYLMDDFETLNRRARLRELIAVCFEGNSANLIRFIEQKTNKRPNQGELSSIQKDNGGKPFADKKARNLTLQIGLHRRWFDMPLGTNVQREQWLLDTPIYDQGPHQAGKTASQQQKVYRAPIKSKRQRAIDSLLDAAKQINDDGLERLIERAEILAESHPIVAKQTQK